MNKNHFYFYSLRLNKLLLLFCPIPIFLSWNPKFISKSLFQSRRNFFASFGVKRYPPVTSVDNNPNTKPQMIISWNFISLVFNIFTDFKLSLESLETFLNRNVEVNFFCFCFSRDGCFFERRMSWRPICQNSSK